MPLKPGETALEYRRRVMEPVSESFCAAKWLNATIWLNSGQTTSCHHPPSHAIDLKKIKSDPSALHNTEIKKLARAQMLEGKRPAECEYCWKIEDIGPTQVSDRVFKTSVFQESDVRALAQLDPRANVGLKTLEIAFDRVCQFACMYCNPSFSTTWVKDINQNGAYKNLVSDRQNHYTHPHQGADPFPENNPYLEAFWRWWPELSQNLEELRITGGEPLLSPSVWRVLEDFGGPRPPRMRLAINSNLGAKDEIIDRFLAAAEKVPHLEVYTSGEAFGAAAEYIRDGKNWARWSANVERLLASPALKRVHVMMTVNALSLFSMDRLLEQIHRWKRTHGRLRLMFSVNILRFPAFQNALVLPDELKEQARRALQTWIEKNRGDSLFLNFERESLTRLIAYLAEVEKGSREAGERSLMQADLKRYLAQYDVRRRKNFRDVMPTGFSAWIDSL